MRIRPCGLPGVLRDATMSFVGSRITGFADEQPFSDLTKLARPREQSVSERYAEECLSLPVSTAMTEGEVNQVCGAIGRFFGPSEQAAAAFIIRIFCVIERHAHGAIVERARFGGSFGQIADNVG